MSAALALLLAQAMPGMNGPAGFKMAPLSPAKAGAQSPVAQGETPPSAHDRAASRPRPSPGKGGSKNTIADMSMDGGVQMNTDIGGGAYESGSGTSRVPAAEGPMRGRMVHAGAWMLMAHGYAWGVVTDQGGPRGANEAFITSMAMLMGDRELSDRLHLQLKSMVSLDPLMGPRGYPNLFATGETAGDRPLVNRQHPHDLFMELAGRVDYRLAGKDSVFLYGGPVAEPALGPAAFMHRGSARYLPLAPITHHWFDSTHITYGVVTAGYAGPQVQLEGSAFRGREPDEHRWNIEAPALDSWSVRASWTPSPHWAAQVSHGRLHSPEAQEARADERRTTATVSYAAGGLTAMMGYGLKAKLPGRALPAWIGEAAWEIGRHHTLFGRIEHVKNDELFPDPVDPLHDRPFRVTKAEGGYAWRMALAGPLGIALGGTLAGYAKPAALDAAYGNAPVSWTLFSKLAVGL